MTTEDKKSKVKEEASFSFYGLINRLQAHSEWKYPNRKWSNDTYYSIAFAWLDKKDELRERVLKVEKEMEEAKNKLWHEDVRDFVAQSSFFMTPKTPLEIKKFFRDNKRSMKFDVNWSESKEICELDGFFGKITMVYFEGCMVNVIAEPFDESIFKNLK